MKNKNNTFCEGIVIKKNNGHYWVWSEGQSLRCSLKMSLSKGKKEHRRVPNPEIVVGDQVSLKTNVDGSAQINEVFKRSNRLARRAAQSMPGKHAGEQVIAANVDQIVAVMALSQPAPRWNLLDRYLVSAESLEIEALICLTKVDAAYNDKGELEESVLEEIETYRKIGYRVILTSAFNGEGLAELKQELKGRVSVLLGKSGAGKSSLLNILLPGLDLRIGEVSAATGKGRHTTTGAEMYACEFGGWLVDTAGTREFGLWDVDNEDMAWFFPEMRPWLGQCRFGLDCQHDEEPGCAVRQAVMNGNIHPRRYFSMMKLKEEGYFQ